MSGRGDDTLRLLGQLPLPSELGLFTPGEIVVHAADLRNEALGAIQPLEDLHRQATHQADLGHADVVDVELYSEAFFGSTPPPGVQHENTQFTSSLGDGAVLATIYGVPPDFPSLVGTPPRFTGDDFLFDPNDLPAEPGDPGEGHPGPGGPKPESGPPPVPVPEPPPPVPGPTGGGGGGEGGGGGDRGGGHGKDV